MVSAGFLHPSSLAAPLSLQVVALCPPSDAATSGSTSRCLDASTGENCHRNSGFFP